MQTFQMAILLLFEKSNELTGNDLSLGVGLPTDTLQKQLSSLVEAKLLNDPQQEVRSNSCFAIP